MIHGGSLPVMPQKYKLRQLGINMDHHQRHSGSCFPPPLENCKHDVSTFRPLPQLAIDGKCHSSKDLHPISDHRSSDFLQEPRWDQEVTFGRMSYLNVVSQGLQGDSKISGYSLSSKHEKGIKAHVGTDSVLKYSGSKPPALSENDARVKTFVRQVPSVKLESTKLQSNSHDSVDCSARMRLENKTCNDHIFTFAPVSSTSSKLVTFTSESEALTANQTTKTAPIFQNVPLTADQFARPSSSASCISTTQLEAESEQDSFQFQSESLGSRRETFELLQGYVPSRHASSKHHIGLHSLPCQEGANSKAVGIITCESDEGSGEVDVISDLLSPDLSLIESILDNSGLENVFYNSSDSRHHPEVFSPGILSNNYASKFSFSKIETAGHSTNDFWQKNNAYQPDTFEENLSYRNKILGYPSDLEIASNSYFLVNVGKSDPLVSKQGEYQSFGVPSKDISMSAPLVFSQPATYHNQPHCIPQTSAAVYTQGNLPQPVKNSIVSNVDSNFLSRSYIDQRFMFQSKLVNLHPSLTTVGQNKIKDVALQDALMNYCGTVSSCSMSSLTAAESVRLVRGSDSNLEEISISDHVNSNYDNSRQFHDHGDYNFQLPDTSCFYNVALEQN